MIPIELAHALGIGTAAIVAVIASRPIRTRAARLEALERNLRQARAAWFVYPPTGSPADLADGDPTLLGDLELLDVDTLHRDLEELRHDLRPGSSTCITIYRAGRRWRLCAARGADGRVHGLLTVAD